MEWGRDMILNYRANNGTYLPLYLTVAHMKTFTDLSCSSLHYLDLGILSVVNYVRVKEHIWSVGTQGLYWEPK